MSNRPKIDLAKLAEQLTGVKATRPVAISGPARPARSPFPRVPLERFEELLDSDDPDADAQAIAGSTRLRAMLGIRGEITVHHHGRPVA